MASISLFAALPTLWTIGIPLVMGLVAVYLLLPRPRPYPALYGGLAAGLALLATGVLLLRTDAFSPESFFFYVFSGIAIVAAGMLITHRNPARAALSFALVVLSTCGLFLLQAGPFLMAATTIIYAGAIVVTFLFVLMLAQQEGRSDADERSREPFLATAAGFVLLGALLYVLAMTYDTRGLDALLARARNAHGKVSIQEMADALDEKTFFTDLDEALKNLRGAPDAPALRDDLNEFEMQWTRARQGNTLDTPEKLKVVLTAVEERAQRIQATVGDLKPDPTHAVSPYSQGLATPEGMRLPAENTAYLGRSLFTDYLLAVEMGGTLLLVATIGAIAISNRREERKA